MGRAASLHSPGDTLTHGLVEGQEALVEVGGPVFRGGRCTEGQPQTVPQGHKRLLTRGAAQRGALLPTEPAWIHPAGCDLKGEGVGRWGCVCGSAPQVVKGSCSGGDPRGPHLKDLHAAGVPLPPSGTVSNSFLLHYCLSSSFHP